LSETEAVGFSAEMQAVMAEYLAAYRASDAGRCAAIYTSDATIYSPFGPPVQGRDAIAAAHESWVATGEDNKHIDILDCAASGDLGYCLVAYSARVSDDDGTDRLEAGTNLMAMVREGGAWRIRLSSMNETNP
jgi:uncharacterized protein (TIGR02246 family)